jgi:dTMP kinase
MVSRANAPTRLQRSEKSSRSHPRASRGTQIIVSDFIAIEGGDGSGKATQTELYSTYAVNVLKRDVLKLSFPRYGEDSAYYVERYLNGDYGASNDVPAELGSLPYAIDRFAASKEIREFLEKPNSLIISDRYVASNLAHQGVKLTDPEERKKFYERTMKTEYEVLGIPRPSKNIVLLMPSHYMQANVDKKSARSYTTMKRDIHEADADHLEKAKANYSELCDLYPNEFIAIQCIDDAGNMRSIEDIQNEIRKIIKK